MLARYNIPSCRQDALEGPGACVCNAPDSMAEVLYDKLPLGLRRSLYTPLLTATEPQARKQTSTFKNWSKFCNAWAANRASPHKEQSPQTQGTALSESKRPRRHVART